MKIIHKNYKNMMIPSSRSIQKYKINDFYVTWVFIINILLPVMERHARKKSILYYW